VHRAVRGVEAGHAMDCRGVRYNYYVQLVATKRDWMRELQIRYGYPVSPDCHRLYIVIVANGCGYAQGPFWLPWRFAVGQENQIKDVRFLFSPLTTPPLWPPKREYNAVSSIADEIWQYRTGGNLTIFNKDHDTAEEGRSQVRQK